MRKRWTTAFGWITGMCLGLYLSYGGYALFGLGGSAATGLTFVCLVLGAFGGMAAVDRLGTKAFTVSAIGAGIALALGFVLLAVLLQ